MTASSELNVGSRVRVSTTAPLHQGRTGIILEPHDPRDDEGGRNWLVRFDWPLGGMASHAVIAEEDLELRQDLPRVSWMHR